MLAFLLLLQAQAPVQRAARTISSEDIRRRIGIIADDSMRGRDTPSPELDKTAQYIAGEYRRLGLKPGGDRGTFLQRYSLDRVKIVPDSSAAFVHGGPGATFKYGADFVFADNMFESGDYAGALVLVSGPLSTATADTAALAGKMVLLVGGRLRGPDRERVLNWKPAGVVFVTGAPDSIWSQVVTRNGRPQLRDPSRKVGGPVALVVRSASIGPVASGLGIDFSAAQSASSFQVKPLAGAQLHVHARIEPVERNSAPNVIGILEGGDPTLKSEYIEAFAGLNPRPKRSIIFLNVSGEEKGLWGSEYFADHPAVPINSIVADLNIDMIGRNWKDTIVAIGKEHSDLGATLNRVGAAHPELNMRPIDDIWPQENFYFRSDHYNFARKGVPILFFFSGTHPDYHQVGDSPDKIDAEKESRVAQLIFYLGIEVANSAERPKWNPDSYKRIVSGN